MALRMAASSNKYRRIGIAALINKAACAHRSLSNNGSSGNLAAWQA